MNPALLSLLVKNSPDVLKKKTKVLDIFNMDKRCFINFHVPSRDMDKRATKKVNNQSITFWAAPLFISSEGGLILRRFLF